MDISLIGLASVVVWLILLGGIAWLLWWLVGYVGLPEPFNKVARGLIAVVCVIILINFLLSLAGQPLFKIRN